MRCFITLMQSKKTPKLNKSGDLNFSSKNCKSLDGHKNFCSKIMMSKNPTKLCKSSNQIQVIFGFS